MKKSILYTLTAWSLSLAMVACGSKDGGSGGGGPAAPAAPADQTRALEADPNAVPADPNSSGTKSATVEIPNPADQAKVKELLEEARRFSGSSNDYLRIAATAQVNEEENENQKLKNLILANSITAGRLFIDYNSTGETKLTLTVGKDPRTAKKYTLIGELDSRSTQLQDLKNKGVLARLQCVDVGTTCENILTDLTVNGAKAKIIFRRTNVNWSAKFPERNCATQECQNMYDLARQSEMGSYDKNTTRVAKLETMEVINGRSTFKFLLLTNADEIIMIGEDLISPLKSPLTNQPADLSLTLDDLQDGDRNFTLSKQDSLKDVRVVSNNGFGKIEMLVKMSKQNNDLQDGFALTVTRINKPILNKIN